MLCPNCGKQPAKRYVRTAEGKTVELMLCPACYAKLYPERDGEDFFTSFLGSVSGAGEKRCPACGTALADLKRTGLVGCGDCYRTFREEILPALRYIQWAPRHEGKRPSGEATEKYDVVRGLVDEREALKTEIERAISAGEYARVRALQDKLRAVNRKLSQTEDV